jgi:hypothetical protein
MTGIEEEKNIFEISFACERKSSNLLSANLICS